MFLIYKQVRYSDLLDNTTVIIVSLYVFFLEYLLSCSGDYSSLRVIIVLVEPLDCIYFTSPYCLAFLINEIRLLRVLL